MNRYSEPGPHPQGVAGQDRVLLAPSTKGAGAKNRIGVEFEAGPTAAASARNALLALDGRVEEGLLADVRLLVSELVTNSVRHSGARAGDTVQMQVQVTPSTVRVEVADGGRGFEPTPRDADRSRPGGWGLYLVNDLADRWGVARNHLTRVWFEMDQGPARGQQAPA